MPQLRLFVWRAKVGGRLNLDVNIIGAGLAGSEAAWQLAQRGFHVRLHEMRPTLQTPAHQTGFAAEMVCSNSFKSDDPSSATGILKEELRRMDSLILRTAEAHRVPAGNSLAVDRDNFAQSITETLRSHPRISWIPGAVESLDLSVPTLLASGPLTTEPLAECLSRICGCERLFFHDAIAPIIERDSIDMSIAFRASRYGHGEADFINCPLDQEAYDRFLDALIAAPGADLHDFDTPYFEACLPIEVMAGRGRETLRHGPMKPVGLDDPKTGRWPYAAVQLRQDTLAGGLFNMVGFQTRLKQSAQKEVFRLIPGLEQAEFARLGSIHRNTYIQAPAVLDATLAVKNVRNLWICGQLSGVEGYLESSASGLAASLFVTKTLEGLEPVPLPSDTMLGALLHYIANASLKDFCPVNAMLGLLPAIPTQDFRSIKRTGGARAVKSAKGQVYRERALGSLDRYLSTSGVLR